MRLEPEEAPVIFRVADQHQPFAAHLAQRPLHQPPPDAVPLPLGRDRDRTDHNEGMDHAVVAGQRHRPALDRADQRAALECGEAEPRDRTGRASHLVRRPCVAIRPERAVKEQLDGGGIGGGEGKKFDQRALSRKGAAHYAWQSRTQAEPSP